MANTEFYLSFVDDPTVAFSDANKVEDMLVASATVAQDEGDFATLTCVVANPKRGLLSGQIWAWFSWRRGVTTEALLLGRLIGIPDSINKRRVTLVFQARPANFKARKATLATTLKSDPNYYNDAWIAPDRKNDPEVALESRGGLWDIDRVTHAVTFCPFLTGPDGLETFAEDGEDVEYDSVDIRFGATPKRSVNVTATGNFLRSQSGNVSFGKKTVMTFTGGKLISDWPKPGDDLGGGWSCIAGYAIDALGIENTQTTTYNYQYKNENKEHENGDTMSASQSISGPALRGSGHLGCPISGKTEMVIGDPDTGQAPSTNQSSTSMDVALWQVDTFLMAGYNVKRGYGETVTFTLKSNIQPIVTLEDDDEPIKLDLTMGDVTAIGSAGKRSFFPGTYGLAALNYPLLLARAALIMSARAVEIDFVCKFERAVKLNCRKQVTLNSPQLPGGTATGKVVKYSFEIDGSGKPKGTVTIGCAIGYGGSVAASPGTGHYAAPGYMAPGYQYNSGRVTLLSTGDVGFTFPPTQPNDDNRSPAIVHNEWKGTLDDQISTIMDAFLGGNPDGSATVEALAALGKSNAISVEQAMKDHSIWWDLRLKNFDGNFETPYAVTCTDLEIVQGIDLEAPPLP